MMTFEKLDAWKSCNELVLTAFKEIAASSGGDKDVRQRLRATCLRAAAKVAFGAGTGSNKMFMQAVMRSAGYLSEFAYHLSIARVIGDLPEGLCAQLDALRGRASFYTWQLLNSLMIPPGLKEGGEPDEEADGELG